MKQSAIQKQVYVVLGMSRSGTSAIARAMQVFDIALGDKLIQADARNPKGFYEDAEVLYKINRGLSRAIDRQWLQFDSPETTCLLAESVVQQYKHHAVELVQERLRDNVAWGFKDPRTDSLLPFWRDVFITAMVEENYIIAVRHPLATAFSNQKFIGIDLETGLLLWIKHVVAAIDGTFGKRRMVIAYENLIQSPHAQVRRMHQQLSIACPLDNEKLALYADSFIDRALNHHHYTDAELKQHPAMKVAPLCQRIYSLLLRVANDEMGVASEAFADEWAKIKIDYTQIAPAYVYVEALIEKNKNQQREIRSMQKALSWKIMFPLRCVESVLRVRRRINKEKDRLWSMK